MARPEKTHLDYFPHDTDMSNDQKIEYLEAEHGIIGYGIYNKLLEKIYRSGYYLRFSKRDLSVMSRRTGASAEEIKSIIDLCVNENLFDKSKFKKYGILTSTGIQKRYIKACERRKNVEIIKDYLISDNGLLENIVLIDKPVDEFEDKVEVEEQESQKIKPASQKEKTKPPVKKRQKEYSEEANALYELFAKTLVINDQRNYIPKTDKSKQKWLTEFDLCRTSDNYEYWQIADIIVVFRFDDFWKDKFNTALKLRKKNKEDIKFIDYFWEKIKNKVEPPSGEDIEYINQAIKDLGE